MNIKARFRAPKKPLTCAHMRAHTWRFFCMPKHAPDRVKIGFLSDWTGFICLYGANVRFKQFEQPQPRKIAFLGVVNSSGLHADRINQIVG